ncbi:hypothetical protein C9413_21615 [Rhizobium sp. SEMIA 4085]|nr:hypothetical protein [Rhizobium sp. SEMIA 4085]NNH31975.1 hypothetical protein [Rhizobium sp. SEMIA 4085]TDW34063.1 hypothetical protein EV128_10470 [Rhizobium azibense]
MSGERRGERQAICRTDTSTKLGKHGSVAKETEVPRRTLVQELEKNSNFFTTEALPSDKLYHEVDIAL